MTVLRSRECVSGKVRYDSEARAIDGLLRVRKRRIETADPLEHESRIYPCVKCAGWHLTSKPMVHPEDFTPEHEQWNGESVESYIKRLERRIKEQRAQLLSLHALGHGGDNRQARKRISALTVALGRMTERWENERRDRKALVEKLREAEASRRLNRRWLRRIA